MTWMSSTSATPKFPKCICWDRFSWPGASLAPWHSAPECWRHNQTSVRFVPVKFNEIQACRACKHLMVSSGQKYIIPLYTGNWRQRCVNLETSSQLRPEPNHFSSTVSLWIEMHCREWSAKRASSPDNPTPKMRDWSYKRNRPSAQRTSRNAPYIMQVKNHKFDGIMIYSICHMHMRSPARLLQTDWIFGSLTEVKKARNN